MQPVVIMSALAVASGLFGGGRASCPSGQCGGAVYAQAASYQYPTPAYSYPQVQYLQYTAAAYSPPQGYQYTPTVYYTPSYAYQQPVAAYRGASAIVAPRMASQVSYYAYPTVMTCPGGSCYRR
jgi:hypothetical protein